MEATAGTTYNSLETFLDTIPKRPCDNQPSNRYYCTVCERLNKPIAERCQYSKLKNDMTQVLKKDETDLQFIPVPDQAETSTPEPISRPTNGTTNNINITDKSDKVEFKVITPMNTDDDYPLIELVQPKDRKIEPIEMELLENVAIEFDVSDDEPMEVEAFEVEPVDEFDDDLEDEADMEDYEDIAEASIVEGEAVDETIDFEMNSIEFKPISEEPTFQPRTGAVVQKRKGTLTKKSKKSTKQPKKALVKKRGHGLPSLPETLFPGHARFSPFETRVLRDCGKGIS